MNFWRDCEESDQRHDARDVLVAERLESLRAEALRERVARAAAGRNTRVPEAPARRRWDWRSLLPTRERPVRQHS